MSKEQPILVAIHCLVYNHEPYLRECLDGFVMQKTNFRFVAIVHEDASKDNSAAVIREYEAKYPDIIIEPSAVILDCGHFRGFAACNIEDGGGICPWGEEADCLFRSVFVSRGYSCGCSIVVNGDIDFSNV